jgi:hypothetical protein
MKAEDVARLLLEAGRRTFPDEASDVDGSELLALLNDKERTVFIEFANLVEEHARAPLEAENKKLTEAISAFQRAWNGEDDQAVNEAFDALGDAKHPSVLRSLGLPPEGGAS